MTQNSPEHYLVKDFNNETNQTMNKARILIVEDEIIIALNIKNILTKIGYSVTEIVSSGDACFEQVKLDRPDLILMDIILEGDMDGIEIAALIRKDWEIPVIFLTAYSDRSSLQKAKLTEPYGYIVKPVNEKDLFTTIETALYRNRIDKKLKESELKYRMLFEQSRDAIFIRDNTGIITDINKPLLDLFGYTRDEVLNKKMHSFIDNAEIISMDEIFKQKGFVEDYETTLLTRSGRSMDCLVNISCFSDENGFITGYQGIIRDVTEVKKIELEKTKLLQDISKRVNELNCLYSLSEYAEHTDLNLPAILEKMTDIIPQSWQYPEITAVRIRLNDKEYVSENFIETDWSQVSVINIYGERAGCVEVCYLEQCPELDEGPFSREERDLINAVAERIARLEERDRALTAMVKSHDELKNLSAHLQTVREEERTRIAREIHDELGQALTALKMDISWIRKRSEENNECKINTKLDSMSNLVDKTIQSVRRISADLRPGILDDLGLYAAIEWQAEEIEERSGISCQVNCNCDDFELGDDKRISIFRIVQEALTNVVRHSRAKTVEINLNRRDEIFELEIHDDGVGITEDNMKNSGSFGLIGMRERVKFCNGEVQINGSPDMGTKINVTIPVNRNAGCSSGIK